MISLSEILRIEARVDGDSDPDDDHEVSKSDIIEFSGEFNDEVITMNFDRGGPKIIFL